MLIHLLFNSSFFSILMSFFMFSIAILSNICLTTEIFIEKSHVFENLVSYSFYLTFVFLFISLIVGLFNPKPTDNWDY